MSGAEMITAERERQVTQEGWTAAHDDTHTTFQLSRAAVCYIRESKGSLFGSSAPKDWPFDLEQWKSSERIDDLVKAGALVAAEIDRLQRAGYQHGRPA